MKIPKSAKRDFEFLVNSELHGIGVGVGCETPMVEDGFSALECWVSKDTYGKNIPCKESELLDLAISGKASWNLQIREWATDLVDCLLKVYELREYTNNYPKWVFKASINQAHKIAIEKMGFIPKYLKQDV